MKLIPKSPERIPVRINKAPTATEITAIQFSAFIIQMLVWLENIIYIKVQIFIKTKQRNFA